MIEAYTHHSPSSCNLFAACPSLWILERIKGIKQAVGAPAHRGTAVEAGVAHGLQMPGAAVEDCVKVAHARYDALMALSPDPRRDFYRGGISGMVQQALSALREYGVPTATQRYVEWKPKELKLPIVGYCDFDWLHHGIVVDLKTTERMPEEIKLSHARQVALYAEGNFADARLCYVTPKKIAAYHLENVAEHRQALLRIAQTVERLLALSDDPNFFMRLLVPDLESFYWSNPIMRALAWEHWQI
jgi:hypothetical protein